MYFNKSSVQTKHSEVTHSCVSFDEGHRDFRRLEKTDLQIVGVSSTRVLFRRVSVVSSEQKRDNNSQMVFLVESSIVTKI